jgi:hypothetical protein
VRLDPRSGRRTGTMPIPGIADAVAVTPHAVWVATVQASTGRRATDYALVRVDPRTMRRTLIVAVG